MAHLGRDLGIRRGFARTPARGATDRRRFFIGYHVPKWCRDNVYPLQDPHGSRANPETEDGPPGREERNAEGTLTLCELVQEAKTEATELKFDRHLFIVPRNNQIIMQSMRLALRYLSRIRGNIRQTYRLLCFAKSVYA